MMKATDLVIVGDIVNTHGLKGEVKILSDSDFKDERFGVGYKLFIINKEHEIIEEVTIQNYRTHKNFDLLTFENKLNINDVERYKGKFVAVAKDDIRPLGDMEGYYHTDIMECVVMYQNDEIGKVHKIVSLPTYDLWYIKRKGKKDILLPFTDEFVQHIDMQEHKIIVNLIEGMM